MRKTTFLSFIVITLLTVGIFTASGIKTAKAATNIPLSGYAWSSNIGWLSFNSSDSGAGGGPYNVSLSTTTASPTVGTLSGYAWSPNIGWVSFDRAVTNNPPSTGAADPGNGSGPIATVNMTTGAVAGWARALGGCAGDMWDSTNKVCLGSGPGSANGISISVVTNNGLSLATSSSQPIFSRADGIIYQFITVTNNTSQTLPGLRAVLTTSLPNDATFLNYGGVDCFGNKYIQYNHPVPPGATVVLDSDIYVVSRSLALQTYSVSAINSTLSEPDIPVGSTLISGVSSTGPYIYNGFPTYSAFIPDRLGTNSIAIQYSDDGGITWHTIRGQGSNALIWSGLVVLNPDGSMPSGFTFQDFGLVNSVAFPVSPAIRQYRAYQLPSSSYPDRSDVANAGIGNCVSNSSNAGWDGWIELSDTGTTSPKHPTVPNLASSGATATSSAGVSLNTLSNALSGYAWGSDVVGWLSFSPGTSAIPIPPVCVGPSCPSVPMIPSVTCSANPTSLLVGGGKVIFTATPNANGGPGAPYTYSWNSGTYGSNSTDLVTYSSTPPSTPTITVKDSSGAVSIAAQCPSVSVATALNNNGTLLAHYTATDTGFQAINIKQGSAAYLSWNTGLDPASNQCRGEVTTPSNNTWTKSVWTSSQSVNSSSALQVSTQNNPLNIGTYTFDVTCIPNPISWLWNIFGVANASNNFTSNTVQIVVHSSSEQEI